MPFSNTGLSDTDWQSIATYAARVGRFVMDLETGLCEVDGALRELTGLHDMVGTVPASDFMRHIHPEDSALVGDAIEAAHTQGTEYDVEFRFNRPDGKLIWLGAAGRALMTASGQKLLIGVNYDMTDQRQAQERAELLAGEMAHRIKNLFTLVQSMFNMAARSSRTREDLIESFSGRLRALSTVNTMTFTNADRRVALEDVFDAVLRPLVEAKRVVLEIPPDFSLSGASAQTVVLALNELMTNAVKHGALQPDGGLVRTGVKVDERDFVLFWSEETTFPVTPPESRGGFGMRVLTSMTAATYNGDPEFDWQDDGLKFRCTWPVRDFAWQSEDHYAASVMDQVTRATSKS